MGVKNDSFVANPMYLSTVKNRIKKLSKSTDNLSGESLIEMLDTEDIFEVMTDAEYISTTMRSGLMRRSADIDIYREDNSKTKSKTPSNYSNSIQAFLDDYGYLTFKCPPLFNRKNNNNFYIYQSSKVALEELDIPENIKKRYDEFVFLITRVYEKNGFNIPDNDNLETRTITNAMCLSMEKTDHPSRCSYFTFAKQGEFSGMEIKMIPKQDFVTKIHLFFK